MAEKIATREAYGKALAALSEQYPEPVSYTHLTLPTTAYV